MPIGALFAARGVAWLNERYGEYGKNQLDRRRVLFIGVGAVGFLASGVSALGPYYDQPNNIHAYYESCHRAGQLINAKLPADTALLETWMRIRGLHFAPKVPPCYTIVTERGGK